MEPTLALVDYMIIGAYMAFSIGVGVYFSKKASSSTDNYFVGGRAMPWWLIGTSMVATTFASDTPLAMTEMVREHGMWRNWFWWNACIAQVMAVFLFARLWRRAEVTTDNELLEIRYSGKPAAALRGFKAFYFAVIFNFLVMGWVIRAMAAVMTTMMPINEWVAIVACIVVALIYAVMSGFYGVVATDMVQFAIAIFGSIYLAVVAVDKVGGMSVLKEKIIANPEQGERIFDLFPAVSSDVGGPFVGFLLFMLVMWWAHPYSDGGGYIIQRMSSCKNEKHSLLATLYFTVLNMVRGWPWIMVALVSLVLFPDLSGTQHGDTGAYPLVMNTYLGVGFKGLLVTSFLAAFMSTIDTHLNWGASYIMTDIYQRFIKKEASQEHYIRVTQITVVLLMVGGGVVAAFLTSVSAAWEFAFLMGSGLGLVLVLRWFWWRITAISEIVALGSSALLAFINLLLTFVAPDMVIFGFTVAEMPLHIKALIIIPLTIVSWVIATFITRPTPIAKLEEFYRRVRPGGLWSVLPDEVRNASDNILNLGFVWDWMGGLALAFGLTFGIGAILFMEWVQASVYMSLAIAGGLRVWMTIRAMPDN
jgi:solute:Na+ symporter, SSS family